MSSKLQAMQALTEKLNSQSPYGNVQVRSFKATIDTKVLEQSLKANLKHATLNPKAKLATKIEWKKAPVYSGIAEAVQAVIREDKGDGKCFAIHYMEPNAANTEVWNAAYKHLITAHSRVLDTNNNYAHYPDGAFAVRAAWAELNAARDAYKELINKGIMEYHWLVKTDHNSNLRI